MGNKAIIWRLMSRPGVPAALWIALGMTWVAILFGGPWRLSDEAQRSVYHQVCALDGKTASGTRTYVGKSGSRGVYLCSFHMAAPPDQIPENQTNKPPYPQDVLLACGILFFALVGAVKSDGYRKHRRAVPGFALALSLYILLRTTGGGIVSLTVVGGFLTSMLIMRKPPERKRWHTW